MASYYYLIASLPELKADGEMPITYDEFLEMCRSNVSEKDMELLERLTLSSTEGPLVDEWSRFYGALKKELDQNYKLSFEVNGEKVELLEEDLIIETAQKKDWFAVSDGPVTVALCTVLTDELIEEGFVRELVSKIQTMRKEAGFDVPDHIRVGISGNEKLRAVFEKNAPSICSDTLCDEYSGTLSGYEKQWDINGESVTLSVEKL